MKKNKKNIFSYGFTLIELLMVISIIALMASIVLASLNSARAKARDASRIYGIKQLQTALELYYDKYGSYPPHDQRGQGADWEYDSNSYCPGFANCSLEPSGTVGWDVGAGVSDSRRLLRNTPAILEFIKKVPQDPTQDSVNGYRYRRYNAGDVNCDPARGAFYILAIPDTETSAGTHPQSPGFSCPGSTWEANFEWVTGRFEK